MIDIRSTSACVVGPLPSFLASSSLGIYSACEHAWHKFTLCQKFVGQDFVKEIPLPIT